MSTILVVDYNTGNVGSVIKALNLFETNVIFSKNHHDLDQCSKIILPGQGSYDHAMKELKKLNFVEKIKKKVSRENIPILGICLGMQILSDYGYENNKKTSGLGLISGEVKLITNKPQPLPNIGWRTVNIKKKNKILKYIKIKKNKFFWFSRGLLPEQILA